MRFFRKFFVKYIYFNNNSSALVQVDEAIFEATVINAHRLVAVVVYCFFKNVTKRMWMYNNFMK